MSFDSSHSANSGRSKSKHSLDSNSSNSKKKQKSNQIQNQKTLGMAWGSNSLSSSKSSSRKSNFPDFGSYMVVKNRKLQDQFDSEASNTSLNDSSNSGSKPLFHGVSIFVDGFTVPSSQELRSYMLKYGGRFENYFSRTRVTHIICSNLPDSKIKNIRSFSRGLPVVKPTWVLDCVAANKLLNWVPYQLDQLTNDVRKQPKLSAFFVSKTNSRLEDAKTQATRDAHVVDGYLEMVATSQEAPSCEVGETIEHSAEPMGEITVPDQDKFLELSKDEPTTVEEHISDSRIPESASFDLNVGEAFRSSPCKSSASANDCLPDRNDKISSPCNAPSSNQHHSTSGDPDFVQNYFKNSRLHFIGTWRNRYRKRFPSLPDGSKIGNAAASTSTLSHRTAIIHVDMDCFFVSVIIRNLPELQDKPVAVCHSNNPRGTAEISSANYPARDFGVRAGMFVRDAKALCPHLVILPYNFEAYEVVADQFYQILHNHSKKVQAVSCDEAFLDVTDREDEHAEHIASLIRKEIYEATGCTASAGIAENVLMARLATRTAKPNGQSLISPEKVESFLDELPIKALPGIGHVLEEKLKRLQIQTCGELRMISKESLQRDFGSKTGNMLWNYSRGIDNRPVGVVQETKSVGADVNWGVRFSNLQDSQKFIVKLCNEVSLRLQGCGVQGRTITMKLKKKKKDAGEPVKYMGCGDCENLSHSMTIPVATDDVDVLQRIGKQLFGHFHIDVKEIRGIGLHVTRLENTDTASQGHERNVLRSWLSSASENREPNYSPRETTSGDFAKLGKLKCDGGTSKFPRNVSGPSYQGHTDQSSGEASLFQVSSLPNICDLDMGVIESLPPEILSEVNEMYGGKLTNMLVKNKDRDLSDPGNDSSSREVKGERTKGKEPLLSGQTIVEKTRTRNKGDKSRLQEDESASTSMARSLTSHTTNVSEDQTEFMPTSLSQVDISILQELPEELKVDILDQLPAHRNTGNSCPHDAVENKNTEGDESVSTNSLWNGNPPEWVGKFEVSKHLILNLLADMYYKSGSTGLLSSILQSVISLLPVFSDASDDGSEDMVSSMSDFVQQYIDVKIKSDMEELYICFRLLRRFTVKSRFFLQVFDRVLPYLQASFGEIYGGNMNV